VEIALDALPGRKLKAVVEALDSQLDANGRSVLVRAKLANADGVLRSGMFARARVVFAVREDALVVPEEALVPQGDKQFVIQLVPGDKGLVSKKLEARIGQRANGKVELLSGLEEGDTVVLAGQARLMRTDGTPVRVVDLNRAGRPGGAASGARGAASAPGGAGAAGAASAPGTGGSAPIAARAGNAA
jgi:membrane fusion protein (multidrug efflux system)